ncbi:MAG: M3 family oligoendopeptidase, partial [Candidatus Sericytochromatia bacterium]|nr:M3 family oligoendopeptidase [Candidatus Sericytochromatia bacterium]
MKFSEIEYKRPDINVLSNDFKILINKFSNAKDFDEQQESLKALYDFRNKFQTMYSISNINYTVNTKDQQFVDEYKHFNEIKPKYDSLMSQFTKELMASKFRDKIEQKFGKHLFDIKELSLKTFDDSIMDELKQETDLSTEYTTLLSSAKINFMDEEKTLNGMIPFEGELDPEIRKKAS